MATSPIYYAIRRGPDGFWRWRAKGKNHEIIASGEAYYNKADCLHAINLLRGSSSAPVYEE